MPRQHPYNVFGDSDIIQHGSRLPYDRVTGGLCTTDTNHSQVHAGKAMHFSSKLTLTNGASAEFTLDTPVGVYVHFQGFKAGLGAEFTIEIEEGDTPTTGTTYDIIPRNRYDNIPSSCTLHDTPVSVNTTLLFQGSYPATARSGGSGIIDDGIEWVLAPGKSYTFRIINESTSTVTGYGGMDWYEEGAA